MRQGLRVGSGMVARGKSPGTMQEMHAIWGAGCCNGMMAGSGAGGGARRVTCCGGQSRWGSWHGSGCCGPSSDGRREMCAIWGSGCCNGMMAGSGTGGGARKGTYCGASSRGGSGHSVGCCVLSTSMGEGCTVVAEGVSLSGVGGRFSQVLTMCRLTFFQSWRARRSR